MTTSADDYEALGGPSVTVDVPASGLVEVWARARIAGDEGAAGLFMDGSLVPGQAAGFCGPDPGGADPRGALLDADPSAVGSPISLGTGGAGALGAAACGNPGPPQGLLIEAPPGAHTFELRYAECSCAGGGTSEFSDRTLWVAPRP